MENTILPHHPPLNKPNAKHAQTDNDAGFQNKSRMSELDINEEYLNGLKSGQNKSILESDSSLITKKPMQ